MLKTAIKRISDEKLAAAGGRVFSTFTAPRKQWKRNGWINPQSSSRAKQRSARNACNTAIRTQCRGVCQLRFVDGCRGFFEHAHEVFTRAQFPGLKPHLNPKLCLGACDVCNSAVENDTARAAAEGLRFSRKFWFNARRFKALKSGMFPPIT